MPNSPEFAVAYYGVLRAGATVTTLNTLYSATEVARQLKDSKAKAYITMSSLLTTADDAARQAGIPAEAIIVDRSDHRSSRLTSMGMLLWAMLATRLRWVSMTLFARPVVPDE